MNFLFAKEVFSGLIFYKVQISTNNEETIHKFVVLSINFAFARLGTSLPVVWEITCIKLNKNVQVCEHFLGYFV